MWRFSGFTVYKLLSCTWSNFTLRRVLDNRWSRYCFSSHCTFQETVMTSTGVSKATGQSGALPILGWLLDVKSHVLFTLGPCFRALLPRKVDSNLSLLWILFTCTYLRCWSQGQSWNQSVAGISNPYHIDKEMTSLSTSFTLSVDSKTWNHPRDGLCLTLLLLGEKKEKYSGSSSALVAKQQPFHCKGDLVQEMT